MAKAKKSLRDYYDNQFGKQYTELNGGTSPDNISSIFSGLDPVEVALQYTYISNNSHPLGSKDALLSPDEQHILRPVSQKISSNASQISSRIRIL